MSTESETKSAGVPAGATQQCAACGQYWNDADWPIPPFTDLKCRCDDVRPIAEAGPAPTTAETPALPQARACIHGAWNCQACLWANGRPAGEMTAHYLAAPTTAAPAELPNRREFHASTPAEFAAAAKVAQGGDTIIVPDWPLPRAAAPAEQLSGKVVCGSNAHLVVEADEPHYETQTCVKPRPAEQPACVNPYHLKSGNHDGKTCYSIRTTPAEQPGKADEGDHADDCTDSNCPKRHTIPAGKAADPRPAQPQAPAEPNLRRRAEAAFLGVKQASTSNRAIDAIVEALTEVAAPLREERDRLAEELETAEARLSTARGQAEAFAKTAREARAKVAARDARIATLTGLLGQARSVIDEASPGSEVLLSQIDAALGAPEGQPPVASSEAPPDALRRLAAKWEQEASEAKDVNRLATLRLCARELRAALSAPPPPPREQGLLGKEGGDGEAEALLRELGVEASGGRVHVVKHWLAAASAPPRKAPQEGCKACALVAKEFGTDKCPWCGRPFGTTVGYVEKCSAMHHAVRSAMGLDKPAYDARPSSPEEQLSGKELK